MIYPENFPKSSQRAVTFRRLGLPGLESPRSQASPSQTTGNYYYRELLLLPFYGLSYCSSFSFTSNVQQDNAQTKPSRIMFMLSFMLTFS